jgi:hypothetical protein
MPFRYRGKYQCSSAHFDLDARWVWMVSSTPQLLCPSGRSHSIHCTGGWVGPRAGLDGYGEENVSCLHRFEPHTFQAIAHHCCTNCLGALCDMHINAWRFQLLCNLYAGGRNATLTYSTVFSTMGICIFQPCFLEVEFLFSKSYHNCWYKPLINLSSLGFWEPVS